MLEITRRHDEGENAPLAVQPMHRSEENLEDLEGGEELRAVETVWKWEDWINLDLF
jgi:hypothetical protein